MPRFASGFAIVLTLALSVVACGSSGLTEAEVSDLVRHNTQANEATCVKSSNGNERDFDCTALGNGGEVKIGVTVGESGDSIFVTHCEVVNTPALEERERLEPNIPDPCSGFG